jgi:hypothetical protein
LGAVHFYMPTKRVLLKKRCRSTTWAEKYLPPSID